MKKITIQKGRVLGLLFRIIGTLLISVLFINMVEIEPEGLAIVLIIFGSFLFPAIWFSFYMLTIDPEKQIIQNGVWIFGYLIGKKIPYSTIEKIVITSVGADKSDTSLTNKKYQAFLQLSNRKKILLLTHTNAKNITMKVKKLVEKIKLDSNACNDIKIENH